MQKVGKTTKLMTMKQQQQQQQTRLTFNNQQFFFLYPNSLKVNSPASVCLRGNQDLFLKMHCYFNASYFKYNDILHTMNVYKIPANEH